VHTEIARENPMQDMLLFRTTRGPVLQRGAEFFAVARDWSELVNDDDLFRSSIVYCERSGILEIRSA
jgi:hypothetical protein